ncbi:cytosine deaminase [Paenibacillus rigui]|uniref:Cytosine deaminase n=1 Tax=Paenibacillus rigui TaxID=554312 RepID=A0A229UW08_9BACL|nr:cytosine deaminase [Paenibacillus rigui]OXM87757.1 cytosine deaminase [Paenibacillus rigui]
MFDLLIRQAKLLSQEAPVDIGIQKGSIAHIGDLTHAVARQVIEASGQLVLPPLVESHIHLDTVLTAGTPRWNESGTLFEGIGIWQERKAALSREDVLARAMRVIESQMKQGILFVRSQADISDPLLTALRALLEVRERVAPYMTLQVIAFPQDGLVACPDNQARLEEAIRLGADGIGAIPHCEPTREAGVESLKICFDLAKRYDKQVHVFCDELDDEHSRFLEVVAQMAIKTGLRHRVTASHVSATAYYNEAYFQKLLGLVARSGIHIVACPLINSAMQGRFDTYPRGRGIARIKEFWQAGVNVSIAHDDIQTPFYPLGSANMMQAAHMALHLAHMTGREELEEMVRMVTLRAARTLGIDGDYGIEVGKPGSMVIYPVTEPADLLRLQPHCRYVIYRGEVLAETEPVTTLFHRPWSVLESI